MKSTVMQGDEQFMFVDSSLQTTVKDFWAWAMSRLIADGPRGDLAEFIVNTALGIDTSIPKKGWGECDIIYPAGIYGSVRIEIKCSSMLQAWERNQPSKPVFSISKTRSCDIGEIDGRYVYVGHDDSPPQRRSEIYVFCLFANDDRSTANPLALEQWRFYIVPTKTIDQAFGDRRSLSLAGMASVNATPILYNEIKTTVDRIIKENSL